MNLSRMMTMLFIRYNNVSGTFDDSTSVSNLHSDSSQSLNLIFIITESKQRMMLRLNSTVVLHWWLPTHLFREWSESLLQIWTSNFGQSSMRSRGFTDSSTTREDTGYISHIISPRTNLNNPVNLEWDQIDVERTTELDPPPDFIFTMRQTSPVHLSQHFRVTTLSARIMTS